MNEESNVWGRCSTFETYVVNGLAFEELDWFESEEVVEQERVGVFEARDDAALCVIARLRRVVLGVRPQQLDHHFRRSLTATWQQSDRL